MWKDLGLARARQPDSGEGSRVDAPAACAIFREVEFTSPACAKKYNQL
jgi:hypothetical protein